MPVYDLNLIQDRADLVHVHLPGDDGIRQYRGHIAAVAAAEPSLIDAFGIPAAVRRPHGDLVILSNPALPPAEEGDRRSRNPAISADARFIAFESEATNLVTGDTNGLCDIFVRDRQAQTTERVSISAAGAQANANCYNPAINADGRFIAFNSTAGNLVPGATNGLSHIFVHDRQTGSTTRVSISSAGIQGNGHSYYPSISADGRFVAFHSYASNLVAGDTNGASDVFVHDRQTGTTTRVSLNTSGLQGNNHSSGPSISADGRFVAFQSLASELVSNDTNGSSDVFVRDRQTSITTRVSVSTAGAQGNEASGAPTITADGRFVTFESMATNLVSGDTNGVQDVFLHDRQTGITTRVSVNGSGQEGNGYSGTPSISGDGGFVAFASAATNLVPGDTNGKIDIFIHDRDTGATTRVSVSTAGAQGNDNAQVSAVNANGQFVAFDSLASNLVPDDTNACSDVFVHDRDTAATIRISVSTGNGGGGTGDLSRLNSTNDGATWSDPQAVAALEGASRPTIHPLGGPNPARGYPILYLLSAWKSDAIRIYRAENAQDWSEVGTLAEDVPEQKIDLVTDSRGRLFAYYASDAPDVYVRISSDEGRVWSEAAVAVPGCSNPSALILPHNEVLVAAWQDDELVIARALDGQTFGSPVSVGVSGTPHHTALARDIGGRIYLFFADDDGDLTVKVSTDSGHTWI